MIRNGWTWMISKLPLTSLIALGFAAAAVIAAGCPPSRPSVPSPPPSPTPPPSLPPAPGCSIIALPENQFTGTCEALGAKLDSGVSDGTQSYPNLSGVTLVDFTWSSPAPTFTQNNGQTCATLPAGAPITISQSTRAYTVSWQPPPDASSSCTAEAAAFNARAVTHECHHVGQAQTYAASHPSSVPLGQPITSCGASRAAAKSGLQQPLAAAMAPEVQQRQRDEKKLFDEFDQTPAGARNIVNCCGSMCIGDTYVGKATMTTVGPPPKDPPFTETCTADVTWQRTGNTFQPQGSVTGFCSAPVPGPQVPGQLAIDCTKNPPTFTVTGGDAICTDPRFVCPWLPSVLPTAIGSDGTITSKGSGGMSPITWTYDFTFKPQ